MQKITVEISVEGYTGLNAENIEKALNYYFGSPDLKVSFSVTDAAEQSVERTLVDIGDGCMVDPLILAAILPE